MVINKMIRAFEKASIRALRFDYRNLRICELGNQCMTEFDNTHRFLIAKTVYSALGAEHVSLDLNGRDGALKIDLDCPVPPFLVNHFDIVTNYGTAEHVNNQFQVFKNMHDMTRLGGIILHALPLVGNWPNHCRYYYSLDFVKKLAFWCRYEIINLKILDVNMADKKSSNHNAVMVMLYKKGESSFLEKSLFDTLPIFDSGNMTNMGNYANQHGTVSFLVNRLREYLVVLPRPIVGKFLKMFLKKIFKK